MKIGVLTFHCGYNFGANLQALATVASLQSLGHSPVVLDFWPRELELLYKKNKPTIQGAAHEAFVRKHLPLSRRCLNGKEVAQEIDRLELDGIIIGADAVLQHWPLISRMNITLSRKTFLRLAIRPARYELNFPNPYWGEFLDYTRRPTKVAVVSASCENTDPFFIRGRVKRQMAQKLDFMSSISVRDEATKNLINHLTNGKIVPKVSPDPVFTLNEVYQRLPSAEEFRVKFGLPERYVLLSFNSNKAVKKEWIEAFAKEADIDGYSCVAMATPGGICFEHGLPYELDIPLDPLDWFCAIKYSSGYVGEKMHPIVVAIHNIVPFFSFDDYGIVHFLSYVEKNSSKIYQLLCKTGFVNQYTSIAGFFVRSLPKPRVVWQEIRGFDHVRCSQISENMCKGYRSALIEALRSFDR